MTYSQAKYIITIQFLSTFDSQRVHIRLPFYVFFKNSFPLVYDSGLQLQLVLNSFAHITLYWVSAVLSNRPIVVSTSVVLYTSLFAIPFSITVKHLFLPCLGRWDVAYCWQLLHISTSVWFHQILIFLCLLRIRTVCVSTGYHEVLKMAYFKATVSCLCCQHVEF